MGKYYPAHKAGFYFTDRMIDKCSNFCYNISMDPDTSQNKGQTLFQDILLRREAGEGWHPDGLNSNLLGAIVMREKLLDEIVKQREKDETVTIWEEFEDQAKHVNELKKKLGITDPPSRSPEV